MFGLIYGNIFIKCDDDQRVILKGGRGDLVDPANIVEFFLQRFGDELFNIFGRVPGIDRAYIDFGLHHFRKRFPWHAVVRHEPANHDDGNDDIDRHLIVNSPGRKFKIFIQFHSIMFFNASENVIS